MDAIGALKNDEREKQSSLELEIIHILKAMECHDFDHRVVMLLSERVRVFVSDILHDAHDYAKHAGKSGIEISDIKLSLQEIQKRFTAAVPKLSDVLELARSVNERPLPIIPDEYGVRIPPLEYCLLAPNIEFVTMDEMESRVSEMNRKIPAEILTNAAYKRRRKYKKSDKPIDINITSL